MPQTTVLLFRRANGKVPLLEWLDALETRDPRGHAKCLQRILLLASLGNELRRPHADSLRDGIHELRIRAGNVQHRILYFFCGQNEAALSHGLTKEGKIDAKDIDAAVKHKRLVANDRNKYTAEWAEEDENQDDAHGQNA
jgi:hypothetical protein